MRRRKTPENEWQTVLRSSVISLNCSLVGTKTISGLPRPGLHSSGTTREDFKRRPANSLKGMARLCRLLLLMGVLLCLSAQLAGGQHWSHGWYPGGKRDLDLYDTSEVSEEIKLCEAGKCSYLRPQGRSILKTLLLDALIRDTFQKRK